MFSYVGILLCLLLHSVIFCTLTKSDENTKDFLQSATDTVTGFLSNFIPINPFNQPKVECDVLEKTNKGRLIPSDKGKKSCRDTCTMIYSRINAMKRIGDTVGNVVHLGVHISQVGRTDRRTAFSKCRANLTKTKLICDCPRMKMGVSGLKEQLQSLLQDPSKVVRNNGIVVQKTDTFGESIKLTLASLVGRSILFLLLLYSPIAEVLTRITGLPFNSIYPHNLWVRNYE